MVYITKICIASTCAANSVHALAKCSNFQLNFIIITKYF